jgi:4-carboxymuconolactone decarboxylase
MNAFDNQKNNSGSINIAAREAEIVGKPQRIAPLTDAEFDDDARALVRNLLKSLGYDTPVISSVFGVMLRHPGLFRCQMEMGEQLFRGELSPRERELAVLRVAWLCGAPYEWGKHVLVAKNSAVSSDEIERVTEGSAASGWSDHERAIMKGVEELLDDKMISDATWSALASTWSERQLIEFPILVGQYFSIALQQNSLRVPLADDVGGLNAR